MWLWLEGQSVITRLIHHMACPYKNWSLSRSGDISRGVKFKKNGPGDLERGWKGRGQVTLIAPLSAKISHRQPIYQIWFLYAPVTKLWIAVQNAENGVVWGGYGNSRSRVIRNSAYDFLSNFNRNYLVPRSRSSELFVESRRFYSTPPVFGAPGRSEPGRISRRSLGWEN